MNEEQLFYQFNFARQSTLKELDETTIEQADKMLEGFSNNIHWNFGHILVASEHIFHFVEENAVLPKPYWDFFNPGTSPKEWHGTPPSMKEVRAHLEDQAKRLEKATRGRLDSEMEKTFFGMKTIGELIFFFTCHENLHLGTIKGLKQALR
ncbi:putative damage-inducible protein DinB [Scopulibacillus daqui]|uniref:Damage-inducible protein DinB n=1 Tax=Scopulibacillus daqui TaxID=1469162 RepID=A0ABS2Q1X7_9BACL|nr:DinB family protein [Scopulibacillus daqui]MBM7645724.1 putative damage-inducible protein DinB [Scopulibacillus daqui]